MWENQEGQEAGGQALSQALLQQSNQQPQLVRYSEQHGEMHRDPSQGDRSTPEEICIVHLSNHP
jgi:hypothetical protein